MKNLYKLLLVGAMMAGNTLSQAAIKSNEIPGAKYVLKNLESKLSDIITQVSNAFSEEEGGLMISGETDFVQSIEVSDDGKYMIRFVLHGTSTDVSRQLKNKVILIIPKIEDGVAHLSEFHCITNIDENYKAFNGATIKEEGKVSRVSFSASKPLFRKCLYYNTDNVTQMWTTGTIGTT